LPQLRGPLDHALDLHHRLRLHGHHPAQLQRHLRVVRRRQGQQGPVQSTYPGDQLDLLACGWGRNWRTCIAAKDEGRIQRGARGVGGGPPGCVSGPCLGLPPLVQSRSAVQRINKLLHVLIIGLWLRKSVARTDKVLHLLPVHKGARLDADGSRHVEERFSDDSLQKWNVVGVYCWAAAALSFENFALPPFFFLPRPVGLPFSRAQHTTFLRNPFFVCSSHTAGLSQYKEKLLLNTL
jgi:hypothetical protein